MNSQGVSSFFGKKILLLQGPVGPFFARLANSLKCQGAEVHKVNFNAGDCFYFLFGAMLYRKSITEWPLWLENLLRRLDIDIIFLYGDCRPIHMDALEVAKRLEVKVGVFEEGYLRPNYITFDYEGVNANSLGIRDFDPKKEYEISQEQKVGKTYWWLVWYGFWYFGIGGLGKSFFQKDVHHRELSLSEILIWIRSAWRKVWYKWKERTIEKKLTGPLKKRYFLVPLQVFNDYQVTVHSGFKKVEKFIEHTISSFAQNSPKDTFLVFKHHPMDRGYVDYSKLIVCLAKTYQVENSILYIHDQDLPSLLKNARGVVIINSSVGFSALRRGIPTCVCGIAFYNKPGITYQGTLDEFWPAAQSFKMDRVLCKNFINYLITRTQVNGSFYKQLKYEDSLAGLIFQNKEDNKFLLELAMKS